MNYRGPGASLLAWAWALTRYRQDARSPERATRLEALVLADHVHAILARCEVDCVLDVGAHAGEYAMALRRAGYRGRIVSFEPQPEQITALARRTRGDAAWTVCPYALGAIDGEIEIELRAMNVFTSIRPTTAYATVRYGAQVASAGRLRVPIKRLSTVLPDIVGGGSRRVFLKMDTQGYDLEVFAGADGVHPSIVGLQSELSFMPLYEGAPTWREAIARYEQAGFVVSTLAPVSHDRDTSALVEVDCVMVRGSDQRSVISD